MSRTTFTTTENRAAVSSVLLASDGVDPERHPVAANWRDVYLESIERGPEQVLRLIHDSETTDIDGRHWPRSKPHDDKTLVSISMC
jgi:hypothetical protein